MLVSLAFLCRCVLNPTQVYTHTFFYAFLWKYAQAQAPEALRSHCDLSSLPLFIQQVGDKKDVAPGTNKSPSTHYWQSNASLCFKGSDKVVGKQKEHIHSL